MPPIQSLTNNNLASIVEEEDAIDILEWFDLVSLESPRLEARDNIDPYLSRYSVPESDSAERTTVVTIRWQGFLPAEWVRSLFVTCVLVHSRRHPVMTALGS